MRLSRHESDTPVVGEGTLDEVFGHRVAVHVAVPTVALHVHRQRSVSRRPAAIIPADSGGDFQRPMRELTVRLVVEVAACGIATSESGALAKAAIVQTEGHRARTLETLHLIEAFRHPQQMERLHVDFARPMQLILTHFLFERLPLVTLHLVRLLLFRRVEGETALATGPGRVVRHLCVVVPYVADVGGGVIQALACVHFAQAIKHQTIHAVEEAGVGMLTHKVVGKVRIRRGSEAARLAHVRHVARRMALAEVESEDVFVFKCLFADAALTGVGDEAEMGMYHVQLHLVRSGEATQAVAAEVQEIGRALQAHGAEEVALHVVHEANVTRHNLGTNVALKTGDLRVGVRYPRHILDETAGLGRVKVFFIGHEVILGFAINIRWKGAEGRGIPVQFDARIAFTVVRPFIFFHVVFRVARERLR